MAEETQHYKTYRLVLDFEVWVNDEILPPYADEEELDEEERQQLTAQRRLLQAILADKRGIYEELLRKRVLEEAEGAIDEEMKEPADPQRARYSAPGVTDRAASASGT